VLPHDTVLPQEALVGDQEIQLALVLVYDREVVVAEEDAVLALGDALMQLPQAVIGEL